LPLTQFQQRNGHRPISTDLIIEKLNQVAGLATCSGSTVEPYNPVKVQHFENGNPKGPVGIGGTTVNGVPYTYKIVPMFPGGKIGAPLGAGTTWQIKCDQVPSNSHIDFVVALSVLNLHPNAPIGSPLYGSPKAASWLTLDATFQASGRPRHLILSRCPIGSCEVNRRFDVNYEWIFRPFRRTWNHITLANRPIAIAVMIYAIAVGSCPLILLAGWLGERPWLRRFRARRFMAR
jgi:hypothetical protein